MTECRRIEGLPHAEADLLGALFLQPALLGEIDGQITPADLSDPLHGAILREIIETAKRGEPVSVSTVAGESEPMRAAASELVQGAIDMSPAEARVVGIRLRERASHRRALAAMECATRQLVACADGEVHRVVEDALAAILACLASASASTFSSATDLCAEAFRSTADGTPCDAVSTGFPDLDFHLGGGLHRGNMLTIGARTSVGKTALALAIARHAAGTGARVCYVSLEMTRAEIGDRLLAQTTGLGLRDLRARALSPAELYRAANAQNTIRSWGNCLDVVDQGARSVAEIGSLLRRRAAAGSAIRLLVVDYAQLLAPGRAPSLREAYTAVSRELKATTKDMDTSLIVLAQLRREAEGRPDHGGRTLLRPGTADLKETRAWEEDSDSVLLLWRDGTAPDVIRAELENNRHGASGVTVRLNWHAHSATPLCLKRLARSSSSTTNT